MKIFYFTDEINYGDLLNEYILKRFNQPIELVERNYQGTSFYCIGSIINLTNNTIIMGSGCFRNNVSYKHLKNIEIRFIRGKLSKEVFVKNDIHCPSIFGDMCFILPILYNPPIKKKYKVGIIPHYIHKNLFVFNELKKLNNPNIKFIDIQTNDVESFIDQIKECELILSSSLHGLITADLYDVPSIHLSFSKNRLVGGKFKFIDYYSSIGVEHYNCIENISVDKILNLTNNNSIKPYKKFIDDRIINLTIKELSNIN
jgi:pyruvyltransferase